MTELRLREDGVVWRSAAGEIVGLDFESAGYFGANAAAACLWPLLAQGTTRDELVRRLADEFSLEREQAGVDVDAFVSELRASGLLEPGETGDTSAGDAGTSGSSA
jgi:Coenzyme PQQ synthesis protein D (PqqD)